MSETITQAERVVPEQTGEIKLLGGWWWRVELQVYVGGVILAEFESITGMLSPQLVR